MLRTTPINVTQSALRRAHRSAVLSASMMVVLGRPQREGDVVHLVAQRITDLSADLASVGRRPDDEQP